jgi:hypothetical protein
MNGLYTGLTDRFAERTYERRLYRTKGRKRAYEWTLYRTKGRNKGLYSGSTDLNRSCDGRRFLRPFCFVPLDGLLIQRAFDGESAALEDVGIDHGGADIFVTQ